MRTNACKHVYLYLYKSHGTPITLGKSTCAISSWNSMAFYGFSHPTTTTSMTTKSRLYKRIIYKCSFNQHTARRQQSLNSSPCGIPFSVKPYQEEYLEDEMMCWERVSEWVSEGLCEGERAIERDNIFKGKWWQRLLLRVPCCVASCWFTPPLWAPVYVTRAR